MKTGSSARILLLGKNGQVGWELQRSLAVVGALIALDRLGLSPEQADGLFDGLGLPPPSAPLCGDLMDLDGLRRTVEAVRPHVIVNAAAYTAVDRAESELDLAHRINAEAPGALAQAAAACGAWLVHYSTDYVFDGSGDRPWREDDPPGPLSVYGRTKLAGEDAIRASGCRHVILRTQWVYGVRGGNFARTMLRLARERDVLRVVADQWGAPTGADLIADVTAHIVHRLLHGGDAPSGTYHLAAAGATTWHGYATALLASARQRWPDAGWRVQEMVPVTSTDYPTPARRPLNGRLDTTRLQHTFGLHLPSWEAGVQRWVTATSPTAEG